jgi:hypothetical protein
LVVTVLNDSRRERYSWRDYEKITGSITAVKEAGWDYERLQMLAYQCQEDLYGGTSIIDELNELRQAADEERKRMAAISKMDWTV